MSEKEPVIIDVVDESQPLPQYQESPPVYQSQVVQPEENTKLEVWINKHLFTSMHNPSGLDNDKMEQMVLSHPRIRSMFKDNGSEVRKVEITSNKIHITTDAMDEV